MLVCALCRSWPCRCKAASPDVSSDAQVELLFAIRAALATISAEYLMWLDGNGEAPEPPLPPEVRERVRALVAEMEAALGD